MSSTAMTSTYVRWMIRRDLESVMQIEKESFEKHAWSEAEFLIALRQRNCIGMVAERNDEVVGYMVYELHKSRIEVLKFAVRKRSQRLSVGNEMIDKLKQKLAFQRRKRIGLEVRETNLDAQLFFKQAGFKCKSILYGWYADEHELTAYRMEYLHQGEDCNG